MLNDEDAVNESLVPGGAQRGKVGYKNYFTLSPLVSGEGPCRRDSAVMIEMSLGGSVGIQSGDDVAYPGAPLARPHRFRAIHRIYTALHSGTTKFSSLNGNAGPHHTPHFHTLVDSQLAAVIAGDDRNNRFSSRFKALSM